MEKSWIANIAGLDRVRSELYETAEDLKVSVIVPVYKVEQYLPACLDSLMAQTYRNFEIVAIDDGSPDRCGEILDEYAKKDPRIKVFHKENGGIAEVRNFGPAHAEGDLIAYVDSDDLVHPDYLRILVSALTGENADIAACGFVRCYEDTGKAHYHRRADTPVVMNRGEAIRDYLSPANYMSVNTWNKVYRKELFEYGDIVFPPGKIYEDALTMHKIYAHCDKAVFVDEPLYYYRQRFGSIMNAAFDKRCLALRTIYPNVEKELEERGYHLPQELEIYRLVNDLNMINAISDARKPDKALWKEMQKEILVRKEEYRNNPGLTKKQKIALTLIEMGMPVYVLARRVLKWKSSL